MVTTSFDKLPSNVVAKAKMCTLDILGGALAANDTKSVNCVRRVVQAISGREESTLIGVGVKSPAPLAAWANSVLANALDIDDGSIGAGGHAGHHGAMVVPASLSLAESKGSTGRSFIEAVVIGYEVGIRAGYIVSILLGDTGSGPMGSYGAVAASAKLLGLNEEETANALRIVDAHNPIGSVVIPSEIAAVTCGKAMTKGKVGWAVLTGVVAALLAREGFTGLGSIYDDPRIDQALLSNLGREYEMLKVYHKCYCSCRLTHAALDGLLELMQKYDLDAEDVIKVTVGSSSTVTTLNNYRPHTLEEAQFSIPFVIGAALVDGKVAPEQINERRLGDKAILNQADKVKLEVNPTIDASSLGKLGAIVKIEAKGGRTYVTHVDNPKGNIENPFGDDELREKFRSLSTRVLGEEKTEEVIRCVDDLENLSNIRELTKLVNYVI